MTGGDVEISYRLTPMQMGMLFHRLADPHRGADLEQIECRLPEVVHGEVLCKAWSRVIARHPVLRTTFRWLGVDEPVQVVMATDDESLGRDSWFREIDLREHEDREGALSLMLDRERSGGFALDGRPLFRLTLARMGETDSRLIVSFPHILMDGRSFPIVLSDLFHYYDSESGGVALDLPELPEFRAHVDWLEGRSSARDHDYWRRKLAGFHVPTPVPGARGAAKRQPSVFTELDARMDLTSSDKLREIASRHGVGLSTLVEAAWALVLGRHAGEEDVVFGVVRSGRGSPIAGIENVAGLFMNTVPVRTRITGDIRVADWLRSMRSEQIELREYEHTSLVDLHAISEVPAGVSLFETVLVYDHWALDARVKRLHPQSSHRTFLLHERTGLPITLYVYGESELLVKLVWDESYVDGETARALVSQVRAVLNRLADGVEWVRDIALLEYDDLDRQIHGFNATTRSPSGEQCIHRLVRRQAEATPRRAALRFGSRCFSYFELIARAGRLADDLRRRGVGREALVGVHFDRSPEMVVAVLAILEAGGAYLPLDPAYPCERVEFMLRDSGARHVLTTKDLASKLPPSAAEVVLVDESGDPPTDVAASSPDVMPSDLAYVIYTSGSTGSPKGVMVEHRSVVNFFDGMDERIPADERRVWLAVTSLSFDISVLELLWTLARGFEVVLWEGWESRTRSKAGPSAVDTGLSLFYFATGEGGAADDQYRLLLEGAKFADRHGFAAVWTPERHFHAFGGLYPNPSVAAAALATVTERVAIRAGSVVLPLHHPIRVAEEWALVDNLSHGRVGVSVASGWQPNDFVLNPSAHARRREAMYESLDIVRRLWRGETVSFAGPNGDEVPVQILPRPIQPELPIWITTAGSSDSWESAGRIGANVLTHLLGQSVDEVAEKIRIYRKARSDSGLAGPGHVTLMLHTLVGPDEDEVKDLVREPMKRYLQSSIGLIRNFAGAWTAFSRRASRTVAAEGDEFERLSDADRDALLDFAFERYYESSGLFGTVERCVRLVDDLTAIGVDEIACLVDFGVDADRVLSHLQYLDRVRVSASSQSEHVTENSLADLIRAHRVTHIQCTPTMARMLVADRETRDALECVRCLMVGGEALSGELAEELRRCFDGTLLNMYGPTETTIWSSTHVVTETRGIVPIGTPIANTQMYVLDMHMQPAPIGMTGELFIGGAGVARGYLNRPDLTSQRFVPSPFRPGTRIYRSGDLVRRRPDGTLEFMGRHDLQVKIRGHRIELGEVESVLERHPTVTGAVAVYRPGPDGDGRLVAYCTVPAGVTFDSSAVRAFVGQLLPDVMVPDSIVQVESFPLTPNRKIDRRALPDPHTSAVDIGAPVQPMSAIEQVIANVWGTVLGADAISVNDSFFDLGGNSLSTIQIVARIRQLLHIEVPLRTLFRAPTVAGLASEIERLLLQASDDADLQELLTDIERGVEVELPNAARTNPN